ncbi:hypothetical protein IAU59_007556 [Kwoniella sp. CBS 9459]
MTATGSTTFPILHGATLEPSTNSQIRPVQLWDPAEGLDPRSYTAYITENQSVTASGTTLAVKLSVERYETADLLLAFPGVTECFGILLSFEVECPEEKPVFAPAMQPGASMFITGEAFTDRKTSLEQAINRLCQVWAAHSQGETNRVQFEGIKELPISVWRRLRSELWPDAVYSISRGREKYETMLETFNRFYTWGSRSTQSSREAELDFWRNHHATSFAQLCKDFEYGTSVYTDFSLFHGTGWFSDNEITEYLKLVVRRSEEHREIKVFAMSPLAWELFRKKGGQPFGSEKSEVFAGWQQSDIILIPIHRPGHWGAGAVLFASRYICLYDSMGLDEGIILDYSSTIVSEIEHFRPELLEHRDRWKTMVYVSAYSPAAVVLSANEDCTSSWHQAGPYQTDAWSCGERACQALELFSRSTNPPLDRILNLWGGMEGQTLRESMADEIRQGYLYKRT